VNYPRPTPALAIHDLRKSYGDLHALRGVTFCLERGERLAFLGPNGAGKTTLIRCLAGLTRADHGEIHLGGKPLKSVEARKHLGFVPQEIALYRDLTTRQNMVAFGRFYGLRRSELRNRLDWALQWTGLGERADDLVGTFSGGMQRRVNLACGVMHAPQILLLDEPTVGVDPQSRNHLFEVVKQLASEFEMAVVYTSHYMEEVQSLCARVGIIDDGALVAIGAIDQLLAQHGTKQLVVRFQGEQSIATSALVDWPEASIEDGVIRLAGVTRLAEVAAALESADLRVTEMKQGDADLETVFLSLTGHSLRDDS
jgi:ABC-2 type transport system ATP-binding protein